MSIGKSGRIVIELDADLKHGLHKVLKEEGLSLKEWFVRNAETYLAMKGQMSLNIDEGLQTEDVVS